MYINTHSQFSLKYGLMSPNDLLDIMKSKGYQSFAVTDINATSCCLDILRLAEQKDLNVAIGIDFRNGIEQQYVGIALNNDGFRELNSYLSERLLSKEPLPVEAPSSKNIAFIYPYNKKPNRPLRPHEYIGVKLSDLNKIIFDTTMPPEHRWVSLQPATFRNKNDHNTHILLRAIGLNTLYTKLTAKDTATDEGIIINKKKLIHDFDRYPFVLHNTCTLLERCKVTFDFKNTKTKNQKTFT
ncbi:MAG: PHP domain-containing protein, partial [Saprospiraceae bacterium]